MADCKIVSYSEVKKYNRIDAQFYLKIKPAVTEFFKTHSVNNITGQLRELNVRIDRDICEDLTTQEIVLLFSLICHYYKYQRLKKVIREAENE